jgi:lysine-N-methylase
MILPDFYGCFRCKAGTCQHTCCRGWDIDIDDVTADYYQQLEGPLGEGIRQHIADGPDGWHFCLTAEGNCPFLCSDGLCQLIRQAGDDILCDICALHPRFFQVVENGGGQDIELGGVGLCCEAACELLLSETGPLTFCDSESGRTLGGLPQLLEWLDYPLPDRELIYQPAMAQKDYERLLDVLSRTEPIDDAWTAQLNALRTDLPRLTGLLTTQNLPDDGWYQRVYEYIGYRQLEAFADVPVSVLATYARRNTDFIALTAAATGDLPEAIRRWSEQIEYDTDNVALLKEAARTGEF